MLLLYFVTRVGNINRSFAFSVYIGAIPAYTGKKKRYFRLDITNKRGELSNNVEIHALQSVWQNSLFAEITYAHTICIPQESGT